MTLDRLALALMALACLVLAWAIPAPFFLATMAGSGWLLWRARVTGRRDLALCAIAMPLFALCRSALLLPITALTPHTLDAVLQPLDFGVGSQFRAWLAWHPWALTALKVVYLDGLPLWMAAVLTEAGDAMRVMRGFVLAAILAVPLYLLCPAVGPAWVGVATAPRNAMPSLHMAWALLAWWFSPRWLRWVGAVLAGLTALACIGLGEHYIVDLVAAIPFTWAVVRVEQWMREPGVERTEELWT